MVLQKIKTYGKLVMFSHIIFSFPFAFISMLIAADGMPKISVFFWIGVAFLGARTGANAVNRLIDKDIDAKNPRTAERHMPKGIVKSYEVILITIFSFSLLALAAFMLNPLCVILLPAAIFLFIVYSYTKRFTWGLPYCFRNNKWGCTSRCMDCGNRKDILGSPCNGCGKCSLGIRV
jgi:4-hydroxybenzoate polyprenyltransferase and related prenyltransferases